MLDCDEVYHELLDTDIGLLKELDTAFPGTVTDGRLNRRALGRIVFSDHDALAQLNAITHRHVMNEVERRLRGWAMQGETLAAVDAIELLSSGLGDRCTATVAVLADRETRIGRIMARDGLSREDAERRVNAQREDAYFVEHCDYSLYNNGDQSSFLTKFKELLKEIRHE